MKRTTSKRIGATVVETALILPAFVMILFGFFEIGHALMVDSVVENAAYEGARRAIVPGATDDDAKQSAEAIAKASSLNEVNVIVSDQLVGSGVNAVTVRVEAPTQKNSILLGSFLGQTNISREVTMIRESGLRFHFARTPQPLPTTTTRKKGRGGDEKKGKK